MGLTQRMMSFLLGTQSVRATLTALYSDNVSTFKDISNAKQCFLEVEYTMGTAETANAIQVKVEYADPLASNQNYAPVSTEWYQDTSATTVGGTATLVPLEYSFAAVSAAATYDRFIINLPDKHRFVRVSIKETGIAVNGGSASVKLVQVETQF